MTQESTPHYHEQDMTSERAELFTRAAAEQDIIAVAMRPLDRTCSIMRVSFLNCGGHAAADALYRRVAELEAMAA